MKGWEKREIPEKTRRPTASAGTIPTCENPLTRPGTELDSPWWGWKKIQKVWAALNSKVLRADEDEVRRVWSSAGMKGRRKREIPKRTRRPVASSGTIPTCENLVRLGGRRAC
ncbi:hypothetical protein PR048_017518 [Dryococelus australis]|uniref:Uncharacterized protein n=1 Tax=Dryococelus australis TaxID=614101 RepID=A0ABQ9H9T9_9NEOP|nr:hypothetical protein PR048_017518 [Dryococelus australis]